MEIDEVQHELQEQPRCSKSNACIISLYKNSDIERCCKD